MATNINKITVKIIQEDTLGSLLLEYNFIEGVIYKVDEEGFKYCKSAVTGNSWVGDCYPCTKTGRVLNGYEIPVPIRAESLIEAIGYKGRMIIRL